MEAVPPNPRLTQPLTLQKPMTTAVPSIPRIPVVCADTSNVVGAGTFNPNLWSGASKGIVQSGWTEYSVLHHCVDQIADMCKNSRRLCQSHVETFQQQWRTARFDLAKVIVYGQVPDLHMRIEAFFGGVKTLLDLLAQLLSSEHIVAGVVDGFHRARDTYGGKILNALDNNALGNRKDAAAKVRALIVDHKALWIDEAIRARDHLIHRFPTPKGGRRSSRRRSSGNWWMWLCPARRSEGSRSPRGRSRSWPNIVGRSGCCPR